MTRGEGMRPAVIRLVDLGLDPRFAASITLAQSVSSAIVAEDGDRPRVEVEVIRTRNRWTIVEALLGEADVIHVVSHGVAAAGGAALVSEDNATRIDFDELAEECRQRGEGLGAPVILADACNTGRRSFLAAVGRCVTRDTAYVGARPQIGWIEGTAFASAFYSTYLRRRGRGVTPLDRGRDAARRAIAAYPGLLGTADCPFALHDLQAAAAFAPAA